MALTKDPDAVLDYVFDWTAWLDTGETIVSHDASVELGDVVIDSTNPSTEMVAVWVSGGTLGTNAEVRCRITTSEGRTDDRTIVLLIREVFAVEEEATASASTVQIPDFAIQSRFAKR